MRLQRACITALATLSLTGCLGGNNTSDPVTDTLAQTPFMYKPDVQQGNVVTQEQVNKLEPGMSQEQVRYLLGSPMLQDTFHNNRWDYVYTMKRGGGKVERKRVALFFEDGQLSGIKGDYRPDPDGPEDEPETVVSVPDQKKPGFFDNTLKRIGFGDDIPQVEKKLKPAEAVPEPAPLPASDATATDTPAPPAAE